MAYLLIFSRFFSLFPFFSLIGNFLAEPVFAAFFGEKYQAVVVGSQVMHSSDSEAVQAIVKFTDKNGREIEKPLNYGSSIVIPNGKTLTVAYRDGEDSVCNLSIETQIPQLLAVGLFFVVLGTVVILMTNAAIGRSNHNVLVLVLWFLSYLGFPLAMLFFIGIFGYVFWQYFMGKKDFPVWVLGICGLFEFFLIPAFFGYLKWLFSKEEVENGK